VAPRDPTEEILAGIWAEVLGVERVGVYDNFFELGGHSLLAMRLVKGIRKTFEVALPLATLLEAPSIARLGERLRQMTMPHGSSVLTAIQPKGERPPLFCVHPGGGTSLCYGGFIRYLGPGQPVYGIQAVGSDGLEAPLNSIEQMAARYLAELRRIQPRGPYRICGWSLGGVLAYEMGRQLYEQDRTVSPLFLIDSYAPPLAAQEPLGFVAFIRAMTEYRPEPVPKKLLEDLDRFPPAQQLRRFIDATQDFQSWPNGFDPKEVVDLWRVYIANMKAGQRYRPSCWPSVILLLQATGYAASQRLRWTRLAARVETRLIPGSHESLLSEPSLGLVAKHLTEWLYTNVSIAVAPRRAVLATAAAHQQILSP
jgi:thioesterase domain-containing protein